MTEYSPRPLVSPTHILYVIIKLRCVLLVAVNAQKELAGQGHHLPVAVMELGGQEGGRPWGTQVQRAAVVQRLGAPQWRGSGLRRGPWVGSCAWSAVLSLIIGAALPLAGEQGLALPTLAAAFKAGCTAQAVPTGASAAPSTVGAPWGARGAAEAGLRGGRE